MKKHGNLEAVVAKIDKEKIPEGVDYAEVSVAVEISLSLCYHLSVITPPASAESCCA